MKNIVPFLLLLAVAPATGSALFDQDSVLEATLRGPLSTVIADDDDRNEQAFQFSIDDRTFNVAVRVRGNSRVVACAFPPLRLNFRASELDGTLFEGADKLKLVTHCRNGSKRMQDGVLNEYAAYRAFNTITDRSYRVRLLRLRYDDTDGKQRNLDENHFGFLIESDDQIADRLGGEVASIPALRFSELDMAQTARMSVFQYLIGNKDWSFVAAENDEICCHNLDLVRVEGRLVPIPYDFDLAAMTRAGYRISGLNVSKRREYSGYCRTSAEALAVAVDHIHEREPQILEAVADVPAIDEKSRERRLDFVRGYFDEAQDRTALLKKFERRCGGRR